MTHLVEFRLDEGGSMSILVEVSDQEDVGGTRRVARGTESEPEHSPQTFEQALSKIRPATEKVISTLRDLMQQPDEIEMEFGFSLSAAAGVIIASASTAANYKVTLHWKRESPGRPE